MISVYCSCYSEENGENCEKRKLRSAARGSGITAPQQGYSGIKAFSGLSAEIPEISLKICDAHVAGFRAPLSSLRLSRSEGLSCCKQVKPGGTR